MANDLGRAAKHDAGTYDLVFEERSRYFFARVTAKLLSPSQIDSYQQKIAHTINICGRDRVMIDHDVPLVSTPADIYVVVHRMRLWDLRPLRYALVDRSPLIVNVNVFKFVILYAALRGIDIQVFNSVDAAEKWLLT